MTTSEFPHPISPQSFLHVFRTFLNLLGPSIQPAKSGLVISNKISEQKLKYKTAKENLGFLLFRDVFVRFGGHLERFLWLDWEVCWKVVRMFLEGNRNLQQAESV